MTTRTQLRGCGRGSRWASRWASSWRCGRVVLNYLYSKLGYEPTALQPLSPQRLPPERHTTKTIPMKTLEAAVLKMAVAHFRWSPLVANTEVSNATCRYCGLDVCATLKVSSDGRLSHHCPRIVPLVMGTFVNWSHYTTAELIASSKLFPPMRMSILSFTTRLLTMHTRRISQTNGQCGSSTMTMERQLHWKRQRQIIGMDLGKPSWHSRSHGTGPAAHSRPRHFFIRQH